MEAVEVFEDTVGGSFAFAAATKGNQHTLYGFVKKDGKWQYWLKNTTVLLNTGKSSVLSMESEQMGLQWISRMKVLTERMSFSIAYF